MAVLLTGGCGYIGSHTAIELIKSGYEVIIGDNFSNSNPQVVERISSMLSCDIKLRKVDFADYNQVDKLFDSEEITEVIHFAGYKAVGESVSQPLKYYDNNLNCTINLLKAMDKYKVKNLVFSSSATVYHPENPIPYKEGMPLGCTNPYGWTKFISEQIILDYIKTCEGFSGVSLRYFNPIGADVSGNIGEDPMGIPNNLMPFITQVAVGRRAELSVYGNDYNTVDGTGVRDYIHVVDLAKGHVKAIEYTRLNEGYQEINLGSGKGTSVLEMVSAFERASGVKIPYKIAPRRSGDIGEFYAHTEKALELLGWQTKETIDDMCRDSWNWQSKNPNGYGN